MIYNIRELSKLKNILVNVNGVLITRESWSISLININIIEIQSSKTLYRLEKIGDNFLCN